MSTKLYASILTVSLVTPVMVVAQEIAPPGGPYQSMQNSQMMQQAPELPEWVKQRQQEMDKWIKEQNKNNEALWKNPEQQPEVPEWVKQKQAEMEQRRKELGIPPMQVPPQQMYSNPMWGQAPSQMPSNQVPSAQMPPMGSQMPPQRFVPQMNRQDNRQNVLPPNYFPGARGPVFGPGVPPESYYGQPVNPNVNPNMGVPLPPNTQLRQPPVRQPQATQPMNNYPPVWR